MDKIFLNACKNNQKRIVETFLKKGGINIDKRDAQGNTPLYYASKKGARDIVKILVEKGADINLANNYSSTPLHIVSQAGNKEIVAILLDNGADINVTDNGGKTPLIYSLADGRTEFTKFLLTKGADKTIKDNDGYSALDYATSKGLRDVVALLVGDTEEKDSSGNTSLHQAVWNNEAEVVNELLKAESININALNDAGESALILACIQNNLRVSEILIDKGAVLHYVSGRGNLEIAKLLVEKGMDSNLKNNEGETPCRCKSKR